MPISQLINANVMRSPKVNKIAFITHEDAHDRRMLSGTAYYTSFLLKKYCGEVHTIDKLLPSPVTLRYILVHLLQKSTYLILIEYLKSNYWRFLGKGYDWRMSLNSSKICAAEINKRLNREKYDCIWVEKSCVSLRHLKTTIPVIYESDATFHAMVDYYPWFTGLSRSALRNGEELELTALQRADAVIVTAEWAKKSAIKDYAVKENKIHVIPSPPNLDHVPEREAALQIKLDDVCTLLFIGTDWWRKGGGIAVATAEELMHLGIQVRLIICGCTPPERYVKNRLLEIHGYLDKNSKNGRTTLVHLYMRAHFFILPTRAECMGISLSEAAAFGLPLIATDTGGVSTIVKNGKNGILLGYNDSPVFIAMKIYELWKNKEKYRAMCMESRNYYDEKICADVWATSVNAIIEELVTRH